MKKRTWLILALVLAVAAAGAVWALTRPAGVSALPAQVSVAEAYEMYQEGTYILDVREQDEWEAGHIPDASLIPLANLSASLEAVPRDAPVVVVCRSGNRSATGRDILREAGYTAVTSMAGGMNAWAAAGYPILKGP